MQVGIISDIHANALALDAVFAAGAKLGVTQWLCTGDIVGYYYEPARTIAALRENEVVCIRGNHDDLFLSARFNKTVTQKIVAKFGSGHQVATTQLSDEEVCWLAGLPTKRDISSSGKQVVLVHGSPWSHEKYVYPDSSPETVERMAVGGADIVFFGHTHYPTIWYTKGVIIANPGSVGQPRNGKPGAHWLLWQPQKNQLLHRTEHYDVSVLVAEARKRDPDIPYLASVLERQE